VASLKKRSGVYYAQWYVGTKQKRVSLKTDSLQVAKERLRQIESKLAQGVDDPMPTRTPIPEIVAAYVRQIRLANTWRSSRTDVFYLRQMFGPCCPEVEITSRKRSPLAAKRPVAEGTHTRDMAPMEAACFEQITTPQISDFIARMVRGKGLAPKTANRYREIMNRLFNWAMGEGRIRMPGDRNPAARVERYLEPAPEIRFLTLPQVQEQLEVLRFNPRLQTLVAVYIYAGLRREEALWLTVDDIDLPAAGGGMIRVRDKTIGELRWQPKTKVNRAVPISRSLRPYLDRYVVPASDARWLFPSPLGRRWDADNFSTDLRAANAVAGLPWACLDYRHTFGSQLARGGVSLFKISALLGNSPEICRRHYAALVPAEMSADVEFPREQPRKESPSAGSFGPPTARGVARHARIPSASSWLPVAVRDAPPKGSSPSAIISLRRARSSERECSTVPTSKHVVG
jgi:integrase